MKQNGESTFSTSLFDCNMYKYLTQNLYLNVHRYNVFKKYCEITTCGKRMTEKLAGKNIFSIFSLETCNAFENVYSESFS